MEEGDQLIAPVENLDHMDLHDEEDDGDDLDEFPDDDEHDEILDWQAEAVAGVGEEGEPMDEGHQHAAHAERELRLWNMRGHFAGMCGSVSFSARV